MGEVYLGHDTVLDRPVAIKLIGSRSRDEASRERFLIEARAIARLSHPNVVTIFRVGSAADGRPFLVQELIRGRSLDQVPRPMPWREVCEVAIGIARGLEAAHRRGILHRDIKPANVMLDESGTPRLLDFGLAKLAAAAPAPITMSERAAAGVAVTAAPEVATTREDTTTREVPRAPARSAAASPSQPAVVHTLPGALLGTPRYMAPERWRGESSTVQSDLYSLGVMLYELLVGEPPFPATDLDELRRAVLAGGAPSIVERVAETPPALADAVTRCLALDPAARPGSAAELAHALEALLVTAPALPEGNPYRGLRAFEAAHRSLFFGRGADVSALVDRLRSERMVVVAGDSGIGKSSVCRAGVVPAVLAGGLRDGRTWRVVEITLGRTPWTTLCDTLAMPVDPDSRALRQDPAAGLLVVIDQLEELVTLGEPAEAARVAELLAAIADGVPGVKALLAVRGDFLTRVAALPALGPAMTRGLHLLRVLSRDDLREAIVGPARAKDVRFESDAMIESLIAAVIDHPGALPLLQFALAELWQARDVERGVIPEHALADLGGVEGALAGHADRVLLELGAPERTAAHRILMRLVSDARTRAVRPLDELASADPIASTALDALVRGRLVVARDTVAGTPTYELAHDALIGSWSTLRDWLDEAAGESVARNRLTAAASEWHRLARKPDLLWSQRQLDEVRTIGELTATEQAFIGASRLQLRRSRALRVAALVAVPAIAVAIYAGVRFDTARRRARDVATRVAAADQHHAAATRVARAALAARTRAFELFDANDTGNAERVWSEARGLATEADSEFREAQRELEAAFLVEAGSVREPMARILWAHAELAEALHDDSRVTELLQRLATYDPALRARWDVPGRIAIDTETPASITIHAASPAGTLPGRFAAAPAQVTRGTRLEAALPAGSYLAIVAASDGRSVRMPFVLARGEQLRETLRVPRPLHDAFVYVPAGRFLYGTSRDEAFRREFLRTPPLHPARTGAYWIARTEITFGDWLEFLRALPPAQRGLHTPRIDGEKRAVSLAERDGTFVLAISPNEAWVRAGEGEPLRYPARAVRQQARWERMPVVGIDVESVRAYADWLDRTGRVKGARLCTLLEWERAARGADGRSYPHGETLLPSEANIDATYDRVGFGLDEVGTHPASDSPFGLHDLAGNASEMVTRPTGDLGIKGGGFFHGAVTALSSNTSVLTPGLKHVYLGARLCANADPAR